MTEGGITGKGFRKGDPRINRKGRPRAFDALRALAQMISHEPVIVGDRKMTVVEVILRQWAQSRNPKLQQLFIEVAYGKVPDRIEMTGDYSLVIDWGDTVDTPFDND